MIEGFTLVVPANGKMLGHFQNLSSSGAWPFGKHGGLTLRRGVTACTAVTGVCM